LAVGWEEAGLAGEVSQVLEAAAGLRDLLEDALEEAGSEELRGSLEDAILALEDLRGLLLRFAEQAGRGVFDLSLLDEAEEEARRLVDHLEDLEWRGGGRLGDALSEARGRAESLADLVDMLREEVEDAAADAAPAGGGWEEDEEWGDYFEDELADDEEEDLL
jgi:hypothetical protein